MANMSKEEGMDGTQWMEKNTTSIKNSEEGKSMVWESQRRIYGGGRSKPNLERWVTEKKGCII